MDISELISGYLVFSIVIVAIIIVVNGGVYLLLRPLLLWYFKINSLVSELRENNALLRDILDEMKQRNAHAPSSHQPKEDYSKYMPRSFRDRELGS